jgi:hypothetical protein
LAQDECRGRSPIVLSFLLADQYLERPLRDVELAQFLRVRNLHHVHDLLHALPLDLSGKILLVQAANGRRNGK